MSIQFISGAVVFITFFAFGAVIGWVLGYHAGYAQGYTKGKVER